MLLLIVWPATRDATLDGGNKRVLQGWVFRSAVVGLRPVHGLTGLVTLVLETRHVDFGKNILELFSNNLCTFAWSL